MKRRTALLMAACVCSLAVASGGWNWEYQPLSATYSIYSGDLGERAAPTKQDSKMAIAISGAAAQQMFDAMYPDRALTCSSQPGYRSRRQGQAQCSYRPEAGYRCYIGLDLRTGRSIAGVVC